MGRLTGWLGLTSRLASKTHLSRMNFQSFMMLEMQCSLFEQSVSHFSLGGFRKAHNYSYCNWNLGAPGTVRLPVSINHFHATGPCSAAEKNYYHILGVSKNASREEIKKAFHALAKKYHSDANQNKSYANRKFQEIRDAYEILQDSEKRAQYDMVENDSVFSRDGADLYVYTNISFTQIPKRVQPGQLLVLRGKGLPKLGLFVTQGNQYVRFRISFPTVINDRQREILEELSLEEIQENSTSNLDNWWPLIMDRWQLFLEHATDPRFMLRLSVVMLLLLMMFR